MPNPTPRFRCPRVRIAAATIALACGWCAVPLQDCAAGEGEELFEKVVRPYLAERCYECHATHGKREQGLALDWAGGLRAGGDSGPAVVPGKPDESFILAALEHRDDLLMPKGGPKPSEQIVAAFRRWIELGAADPRATAPSAAELAREASWEAIFARRRRWWSLQPINRPPVPARSGGNSWLDQSDHPVDRFIAAKLAAAGIEPAGPATPEALLRRARFVLTGLPPTPEERAAFLADTAPDAWERLVDRLIASPEFAERWARHWLDCVRYCETHGSEGDPAIPHAWRFRDWCIRAIRDDLPIDRFIREQIAGDLLAEPRIDPETGINESAVGVGQLRMVPHGYAPTDALDEFVTFTDNQIDVISKAFLGMTVSCARCHNHKFDAISQTDFYALFGTLASCRPAVIQVDAAGRRDAPRAALADLKSEIRGGLAAAWLARIAATPAEVRQRLADRAAEAQKMAWPAGPAVTGDARGGVTDLSAWFRSGTGLGDASPPGAFRIEPEGEQVVRRVLPAGVHSNLLVASDGGVLHSPRFEVTTDAIHVLLAGSGKARLRIVVRNYPRVVLIYPHTTLEDGAPQWVSLPTAYWKGEMAHLEIATAGDLPIDPSDAQGSWFSVVAVDASGTPPRGPRPSAIEDGGQLTAAIEAWKLGHATTADADLIDAAIVAGALPTRLAELAALAPELPPLIARYRALDAAVPPPTRAAGVFEGSVIDQPLFIRGDHRRPGAIVPRRFLEALDPTPFPSGSSGRLQLADALVAPANPLTPRVFVNRLWHHVFGRGIVASVDTFGEMGDLPTHPELLDFLASRFVAPTAADQSGPAAKPWSLKALVRALVTSRAFRLAAAPTASAARIDPGNALFAHARLRRLEGEAIRDALLAVSGRLDREAFGPPVPGSGTRRSIYLPVRRNAIDPFLGAFDPPSTQATQGRRDESHVPAQSLVLMNGPFVRDLAKHRATRIVKEWPDVAPAERIRRLFIETLGREPSADESATTMHWLAARAAAHGLTAAEHATSMPLWADVCHALVNLEEFIHVD